MYPLTQESLDLSAHSWSSTASLSRRAARSQFTVKATYENDRVGFRCYKAYAIQGEVRRAAHQSPHRFQLQFASAAEAQAFVQMIQVRRYFNLARVLLCPRTHARARKHPNPACTPRVLARCDGRRRDTESARYPRYPRHIPDTLASFLGIPPALCATHSDLVDARSVARAFGGHVHGPPSSRSRPVGNGRRGRAGASGASPSPSVKAALPSPFQSSFGTPLLHTPAYAALSRRPLGTQRQR